MSKSQAHSVLAPLAPHLILTFVGLVLFLQSFEIFISFVNVGLLFRKLNSLYRNNVVGERLFFLVWDKRRV